MSNISLSQKELEKYLWGAAEYLRGKIDSSDYREYIFPLLFFKRISDVYDEEHDWAVLDHGIQFPEDHRFQIPKGAHWEDVRSISSDVGTAIFTAMKEIEGANPDLLFGIFGRAKWTNKDKLSDEVLRNLIEHFSKEKLTIERVPQDELGQGYEYLIKQFADDAGHTAAEFYTNRSLVKVMTEILCPHEGESLYDPTCGSGGMLLIAALQLKEQKKNYRSIKLYGQEINHITSAIARMNLFLHGIEDFKIIRDDVLHSPGFLEDDKLETFDMVLANPPYSIKEWNKTAFESDPYGRNFLGNPPQGRADYAFFQHILKSMKPETGRCAILFPHGVLSREDERSMRKKLVEMDVVECVLGLAPNLFYGATMEACVIVCRMKKPSERIGKVLFIDALNEGKQEKTQAFIEPEHRKKILSAYHSFGDVEGFCKVATNEEILANDGDMRINYYVDRNHERPDQAPIQDIIYEWKASSKAVDDAMAILNVVLKGAGLHD